MAIGSGPWIGSLAVQYVLKRRRRGLAAVTAANYRSILGGFVRAVGDRPVDRVTRRQIDRWLETLGPYAPSTRRGRVVVVRGFCGWLLREGYVDRDLLADVTSPREPRRLPRGVPGGATGVAQILAHCPDSRARLIVTLEIQLGLRCGEVSRLQVGDIDLHERSVRVIGKGQHERVVSLTDEAEMALRDYLSEHPAPAGPLVRSYRRPHRPLYPDTISHLVGTWMLASGVKRRPGDGVTGHSLRHQAAHDLLRGGASPRDVQKVLGHRHLATTEIYLPSVVEPLAKVMSGRWYGRTPRPAPEEATG